MEELVKKVEQWHVDRNLIDGASDKDQVLKLIQEMGELSDNVCKGNDIRDDLGDMLVVMINIMKRNNITTPYYVTRTTYVIRDSTYFDIRTSGFASRSLDILK